MRRPSRASGSKEKGNIMSWSFYAVSRNKEKLKEAVKQAQCKDEVNNAHSGIPSRTADLMCREIDRIRINDFAGKVHAIKIDARGSWHEQAFQETVSIDQIQMIE